VLCSLDNYIGSSTRPTVLLPLSGKQQTANSKRGRRHFKHLEQHNRANNNTAAVLMRSLANYSRQQHGHSQQCAYSNTTQREHPPCGLLRSYNTTAADNTAPVVKKLDRNTTGRGQQATVVMSLLSNTTGSQTRRKGFGTLKQKHDRPR